MKTKVFNVYRLEHKLTNNGPWSNLDEKWEQVTDYYSDKEHPGWKSDFNENSLEYNYNHDLIMKIGVAYPCQIIWWFGRYIDLLFNEYNIYQIKVKKFKKGFSKKQVLFLEKNVLSKTLIMELKSIF